MKIFVGGAPVSASYASQIGADGYGATAVDAVNLAKGMVAASAQAA